jgi:FkbM family methyltransferase
VPSRLSHVVGLIRAAGVAKAIEILARRVLLVPGLVSVHARGYIVDVRPRDSDLFALSQIFGWEEYGIEGGRLAVLRRIATEWQDAGIRPLIIDGGANVGYSALYFSGLFPDALVLAIEPDRTSFEILERHVRTCQGIRPIHAALWWHDRGLALQTSGYGSWGNRAAEGSGTPSQRLDDLIASVPNGRALVVKLDIEGAEREVVESCPEIFAEAKCIMVEPHDFKEAGASCLSPLYQAVAGRKFDTILSGENLVLFAADQRWGE